MVKDLEMIKKEVDRLGGKPIDEKIKPLVIGLRYHRIKTTASCQGHTDRGRPYPWVSVGTDLRLIDGLLRLVVLESRPDLLGGLRKTNIWILKPELGEFVLIPCDKKLPLEELQRNAIEFGAFLQQIDNSRVRN